MFTFDATPVKFVALLVMFLWCTAWCIYEVTRRQSASQRVSNGLHVLMAVVMLAMVSTATWKPLASVVPASAWAVVFGVCVVWFLSRIPGARAAGDTAGVKHFAGHSLMFGAMSWHLAAMAVKHSAKQAAMGADHGGTGQGDAGHSGMQMDAAHGVGMDAMSAQGSATWWFAVVGLIFMTYLLIASFIALTRVFKKDAMGEVAACCAEIRTPGTPKFRLAALSDFAMNFGMFWMSTGLMVPLLPFFAALSF